MDRQVSLSRTETFSFINPWIRYFLFFFSFLFWIFSLLIVAIGVYAKVQKATDAVRDTFLIDPAVILIVVGVVMFFITFCGCIGALRENIRLLKIFSFSLTLVFLNQMAIAILGFFYSDQTRDALGKFVKKAIVHYRDDLDLQNLMDYIQQQFKCCGWNNYTDWSWNLYFNCSQSNPSTERCAVPFSCCTPLPGEEVLHIWDGMRTVINTMCGFGVQTQNSLDATKSIYPVGCSDRAVVWIESHLLFVGALALGLALPQIAGIVLSQILISEIRKEIRSVF
ncbi:tetraspanin-33b isoform X1 [Myxocyprinus asiaticus]|uniref:tetraspanin-33b isoform X1 n=1 Tax=Myxocyprinus asiaticus TaxID=70543 RepID=UPI002222BD79|nr:tetraspanin-33b isoform X1 [Myxocyprinus asiaticus]